MTDPTDQTEDFSVEPAHAEPRLKHLPISIFAIIMGLSGLTLATERLEKTHNMGHGISPFLLGVTSVVFLVLLIIYGLKCVRFSDDVKAEWKHPVRLAFFPAISISVILVATAALPFNTGLAHTLWLVGASLHILATLLIVNAWINRPSFEAPHLNPAWFIPAVGNVIVPIAGSGLGYMELSWFFFATGMLFWLVLLTLVFNRLIFHKPMPARLVPTLMILVAPPAVAFVAYMKLTGTLDPFGRVLYGAVILFALIVLTQVPKLIKLPFALSWWAYSFPLAAMVIATFVMHEATKIAGYAFLANCLYGLLLAVIAGLLVRTAMAISRHEICQPE